LTLTVGLSGSTLLNSGAKLTYAQSADDAGVATISGKFTVSNPFILEDYAEPYIALIDLTAFVKRDKDMPLPFPDQTIGRVDGDPTQGASYVLPLPIEPRGQLNDVSNGNGKGKGVMVFAVDLDTNAIGDPFQGPFEWRGWPGGEDSLQFDPGTGEVVKGMIVVYAPDDNESFPTDFGADGQLFTKDDPVAPIKKGWTIVNLDKKPFEQIRTAEATVPLLEGLSANNDLSNLSYTQAFDALVKDLKVRYPFNDYKKIDWDTIVKEVRPLVEKAETDKDALGFNVAMLKFVTYFKDGHMSVQTPNDYFAQQTAGGIGLVLGETDDKTVIARAVVDGGPAASAGIKAGATILEWNGKPIEQALDETQLLFVSQSSPTGIRLQQLRYIMRTPVGTKFTIKFQNPDDKTATTADMVSVKESKSFALSSQNIGRTPEDMPIILKKLPSGIGYIKITTFSGDAVLNVRMWEFALQTLLNEKVPAIIIDARQNGGGRGDIARYFAGSFYTKEFQLDETLAATKGGQFVSLGKDIVQPSPVQWTSPVAVLVGPACYSACEIFSAAMAHDPAHLIVGRYPSAGVEAGVEPWTLPDGLYFQSPVYRIVYPDGKIFLEGVGVIPTLKVPVTAQSLLSTDDLELQAADKALSDAIKK
jgi:C-terminal processing protease CtpA/Prc